MFGGLTPEASDEEDSGKTADRPGGWVEEESCGDHTHHQEPEKRGDQEKVQENGKHWTQHLHHHTTVDNTSLQDKQYVYTVKMNCQNINWVLKITPNLN